MSIPFSLLGKIFKNRTNICRCCNNPFKNNKGDTFHFSCGCTLSYSHNDTCEDCFISQMRQHQECNQSVDLV